MEFIKKSDKIIGVLLPIFSLKSKNSLGCGDFFDLINFAKILKGTGISMIQILPLNDSGSDNSPYNALSSCALSPIYLRLQKLMCISMLDENEKKKFTRKITNERKTLNVKYSYKETYDAKIKLLKNLYEIIYEKIIKDENFLSWAQENSWTLEYAVYKVLKDKNLQKSHTTWEDEKVNLDGIKEFIEQNKKLCYFYIFIQYEAEHQALQLAETINKLGMYLKGDIPILIARDSSDVYFYNDFFKLNKTVGASPDSQNREGQNWGFPAYNWENLEKENYSWWKRRIKQADKFYHAYRVDHILGFFRIWNIDSKENSGILGYFSPSASFSESELEELGFDRGRIKWLCKPHISLKTLESSFGMECNYVIDNFLNKLENEDLYLFKENIYDKDIENSKLREDQKTTLLYFYKNRVFIEDEGKYYKAHYFYECERFNSLDEKEKQKLNEAFDKKELESQKIWEEQGLKLLSFMKNESKMLVCGEDLGSKPDATSKVLRELNILSLKVLRWNKDYPKENAPWIKLEDYPKESVFVSSVHDTSTLKDWWNNENERAGIETLFDCPIKNLDKDSLESIIKEIVKKVNSFVVLFSIQDILNLFDEYSLENERDERINLPGTVGDANWIYQIPNFDLILKDNLFKNKIKDLLNYKEK